MSEWWLLILVGFLPTEVWRWAGVFASKGLDLESDLYLWVKSIATATMAAVVAKICFFPSGALAEISDAVRLMALLVGIAAYYLAKKRVLVGVLTGQAALIIAAFMR